MPFLASTHQKASAAREHLKISRCPSRGQIGPTYVDQKVLWGQLTLMGSLNKRNLWSLLSSRDGDVHARASLLEFSRASAR